MPPFKKPGSKPLPGRRTQIAAATPDPVRAVYVRILTAANTGIMHNGSMSSRTFRSGSMIAVI
jgi:hypothetical protein